MDELQNIVVYIGAIVTSIGVLVSRWRDTNPENPWYIRAMRVIDFTQVIDSSRDIGD